MFQPLLAKNSKSFSLADAIAVGVDRMQRNFGPLARQIREWREAQISDEIAKLVIYPAFV